jgi:hypothetical protein
MLFVFTVSEFLVSLTLIQFPSSFFQIYTGIIIFRIKNIKSSIDVYFNYDF